MAVKRIVANIATPDIAPVRRFYETVFGLEALMDLGWIVTLGSEATPSVQISIASHGGSGTPVPDLSIEVDDLGDVERRLAAAGIPIAYGPADEPWGVRRLYVRDPAGRLLNVLAHR